LIFVRNRFFVTLFNFPEICQKGVMLGKVQPVDERILERWLLRPWATGSKVKALREFVLVRAAMMGLCTTLCVYQVPCSVQMHHDSMQVSDVYLFSQVHWFTNGDRPNCRWTREAIAIWTDRDQLA
jgi:hypothetical protein